MAVDYRLAGLVLALGRGPCWWCTRYEHEDPHPLAHPRRIEPHECQALEALARAVFWWVL